MVSYSKLFKMLKRRKMKKNDLLQAGISSYTVYVLGKGRYVKTDTICKLCQFLGCQPDDIFSCTPGEDNEKTKG